MKQVIAVPVDENDMLAPHMGHSKVFDFYEVNDGEIVSAVQLKAPPHQPGVLPKWLIENNVTDLLTGGAGQKAVDLLNEGGVKVHVGSPKKTSHELATLFLNGELEFSGNACDH
ncbi:ATPase [Puteibacter caeruleilacunae]|nr:ATPase [Puteibacter caeruleilacunae]